MTDKEFVQLVKKRAEELGSASALAREIGFTPAYLSDVFHGRRGVSDNLLSVFGYKRTNEIVKKDG